MKHIQSYSHYREICQAAVQRPCDTNFHLLPSAVKALIESGQLLYDESQPKGGLLLYIDYPRFYTSLFFFNSGETMVIPPQEKPVVINIVYPESVGIAPVPYEILQKSGFQKYELLEQFCFNAVDSLVEPPPDGYSIDYAKDSQIPVIQKILDASFSNYLGLPNAQQLSQLIKDQAAFSVISPAGQVCGYMQLEKIGNTCFGQHIGISAEERGKGLGKKLYVQTMRLAQCKEYRGWVNEQNVASQRMHYSLGFQVNEMRLLRLIQYPSAPRI